MSMLKILKRVLFFFKRDVIPQKYNCVIRCGVIAVVVLICVSVNKRTITFTHFDQEAGVKCLLDGEVGKLNFTCKSDNLIGVSIKKVSPEKKTWHYSNKDGGVDVSREGYSKGIMFTVSGDMFKGVKKFKIPTGGTPLTK